MADKKRNKKVGIYLEGVKKDILANISHFLLPEEVNKNQQQPNPKPEIKEPWLNYRVNLFVDNNDMCWKY